VLPGRSARELARLLPELGEPDTGVDPDEARARMFAQVLALFEHLAESGPLVLVVEDTTGRTGRPGICWPFWSLTSTFWPMC
jgi:hypothetical protein